MSQAGQKPSSARKVEGIIKKREESKEHLSIGDKQSSAMRFNEVDPPLTSQSSKVNKMKPRTGRATAPKLPPIFPTDKAFMNQKLQSNTGLVLGDILTATNIN